MVAREARRLHQSQAEGDREGRERQRANPGAHEQAGEEIAPQAVRAEQQERWLPGGRSEEAPVAPPAERHDTAPIVVEHPAQRVDQHGGMEVGRTSVRKVR